MMGVYLLAIVNLLFESKPDALGLDCVLNVLECSF